MTNINISSFKLATGEEIIAELVLDNNLTNSANAGWLKFKNPAIVVVSETGLALQAFMVYAEGPIAVSESHILATCEVSEKVKEYYNKLFNPTQIVTPDKNIILPS